MAIAFYSDIGSYAGGKGIVSKPVDFYELNWDPSDTEGLKRYKEWKNSPISKYGTIGTIPPINLKKGAKITLNPIDKEAVKRWGILI